MCDTRGMYTPPRTSRTSTRGHETSSEHTLEHSPAMAAYLRNQVLLSQPPGRLLSELSSDFVRFTYEDLQDARGQEIVSSMLTVIGRAQISELPKQVLESLYTCIVDKGYENVFPAETECGMLILEVRKCLSLHTTTSSCIPGDAEAVEDSSVETDADEDMLNTSDEDVENPPNFDDANEMNVAEDIDAPMTGVGGEEEAGPETKGSNDLTSIDENSPEVPGGSHAHRSSIPDVSSTRSTCSLCGLLKVGSSCTCRSTGSRRCIQRWITRANGIAQSWQSQSSVVNDDLCAASHMAKIQCNRATWISRSVRTLNVIADDEYSSNVVGLFVLSLTVDQLFDDELVSGDGVTMVQIMGSILSSIVRRLKDSFISRAAVASQAACDGGLHVCEICRRRRSLKKELGTCSNVGGSSCRRHSKLANTAADVVICQYCTLIISAQKRHGRCYRANQDAPQTLSCRRRQRILQRRNTKVPSPNGQSIAATGGIATRQDQPEAHANDNGDGVQFEGWNATQEEVDVCQGVNGTVYQECMDHTPNFMMMCSECRLPCSKQKKKGVCYRRSIDAPQTFECQKRQRRMRSQERARANTADRVAADAATPVDDGNPDSTNACGGLYEVSADVSVVASEVEATCSFCKLPRSTKKLKGVCWINSTTGERSKGCRRRQSRQTESGLPSQFRSDASSIDRTNSYHQPHAAYLQKRLRYVNEILEGSGASEMSSPLGLHLLHNFPEGPNVFVTGIRPAGTGKSMDLLLLSRKLLQYCLDSDGYDVGITCSTGYAAGIVGGVTFHSFFGIRARPINARTDSCYEQQSMPRGLRARLSRLQFLIIDEEVIICFYATCSCAEFRAQATRLGGKSRAGRSKLCLDIQMVLLSLCVWAMQRKLFVSIDSVGHVVRKWFHDHVEDDSGSAAGEYGGARSSVRWQLRFHLAQSLKSGILPLSWDVAALHRFQCDVVDLCERELGQRSRAGSSDTVASAPLQKLCEALQNMPMNDTDPHSLSSHITELRNSVDLLISAHSSVSLSPPRLPAVLSRAHVFGTSTCNTCPYDDKGCRPALQELHCVQHCNLLVDRVIKLNHVLQISACCNTNCSSPFFCPWGTDWTERTGLFAVRCNWQLHVLTLDRMTSLVRGSRGSLTPTQASALLVQEAITFFALCHPGEVDNLPATCTIERIVYDGWYAYTFQKFKSLPQETCCLNCGYFPDVILDARAKTCIGMGREAMQAHLKQRTPLVPCNKCNLEVGTMDPQIPFPDGAGRACALQCGHVFCLACLPHNLEADSVQEIKCPSCNKRFNQSTVSYLDQRKCADRLWTKCELLDKCGSYMADKCAQSNHTEYVPIDVQCVPPLIGEEFQSKQLFNGNQPQSAQHVRSTNVPSKRAMTPFANLVAQGVINIHELRMEEGCMNFKDLQALVRLCDREAAKKLTSAAQARGWLLDVYDMLMSGTSECHDFFKAPRASGGVLEASCPHGYKLGYMHLFEQESVRHVSALLRSFNTFPRVVIYDASCGLVAHMEGVHPTEAAVLWKDQRGCFVPWRKDGLPSLEPIQLSALSYTSRVAAMANADNRNHASQIRQSRGDKRLESHPLSPGFSFRLVLTDRFHQSLKSVSHKRASCMQHKIDLCPQLADIVTTTQESLNHQANRHTRTLCNQDAEHHIWYTYLLFRWHNMDICASQRKSLEKELRPFEKLEQDEIFGVMRAVCTICLLPSHAPDPCKKLPTSEGTASPCGHQAECARQAQESITHDKGFSIATPIPTSSQNSTRGNAVHLRSNDKDDDISPWEDTASGQLLRSNVLQATNDPMEIVSNPITEILRRSDFQVLKPTTWLNDAVINNFLEKVTLVIRDRDIRDVHIFSTLFWTRLVTLGNASVQGMARLSEHSKHGVFHFHRLIIPIHHNHHFTLLQVDMKGLRMDYYDSLDGDPPNNMISTLQEWLNLEHERVFGRTMQVTFILEKIQGPRQTNSWDCGIFCMLVASCLASGSSYDHIRQDMMPRIREILICELAVDLHEHFSYKSQFERLFVPLPHH